MMFSPLKTRQHFLLCKSFQKLLGLAIIRNFKFAVGDVVVPNQLCGLYYLKDPRLNKGLAFTLEERQHLTIQGLQPPRTRSLAEQIKLMHYVFNRYKHPLDKYMFLSDLHERNVQLYFRLIHDYIEETMPIVYTPTVGQACQTYGSIYRNPNGLYITYHDKGHVSDLLTNWPEAKVRAICITDGERILGLGDLGCNGMGIAVGKLALYTTLGGIKPHMLLPVMLDVGTNNESLIHDPFYMGLRMKRIDEDEYICFMDEVMDAIKKRYGSTTLIHFEDLAFNNAVMFLERYESKYCVFNDDIQGTGAIGLAGFMGAALALGTEITEFKYLFVGAGGANMGISSLLVQALLEEGLTIQEAVSKIFICDADGLVTTQRQNLSNMVQNFAKNMAPINDLLEIVETIQPNVLIGATAQTGLFSPEILRAMAEFNKRPVIFALSNPTHKAECTAEQAFANTEGRAIFCSGSPMPPVEYNGKVYEACQANNAYIYPGVALGLITCKAHHCYQDMFIIAAREMVRNVPKENIEKGIVYPSIHDINEVSVKIATKIAEHAFRCGLAATYPQPDDMESFIRAQLYCFDYQSVLPATWSWPDMPSVELGDENISTLVF